MKRVDWALVAVYIGLFAIAAAGHYFITYPIGKYIWEFWSK